MYFAMALEEPTARRRPEQGRANRRPWPDFLVTI